MDDFPNAFADKQPRVRQFATRLNRACLPAVAAALDRAAERIASRVGSPLPLLLTLSLVQGLLWLWSTFGPADHRIVPRHVLTILGAGLYQPDHDLPIYLFGALSCVLLDALLATLLARRSARADSPSGPRAGFVACAAVALLPLLAPDSKPAYLAACVMGLGLVAWRLHVRRRSPPPCPQAPVPLAPSPDAATRQRPSLLRGCAVPLAIVALFVFVPWPEAVLWKSYESDRFHHFDFYMMAPALAHAHGLRLGSDFYSQYGVGWPMVLHWLGGAKGLAGYTMLIRLEVLVGCAYFLALFVFLRSWLRSASWATTGLLLALILALFTDTGIGPKWLWPSSTVMRYAFDIMLFGVLVAHARSGDSRLGLLAGVALALQILFSSDVGLYLLFAFGIYLVCAMRRPAGERAQASLLRFALGAGVALVLVAGAGFTLANQGEPPGRAFWSGLTESIFVYGGGIGNLPIALALGNDAGFDLLLLAMLALYFRCMGAALSACIERRVSPDQAIRAAIAAYGLGTLMIFIGRSHQQNLMHVTIPFCLLVADLATSTARAFSAGAAARGIRPQHLLWAALVATICVQSDKVAYPNLVNAAMSPFALTALQATSGDALPAESPREVAEFRAASDAIRQASDGGRNKVAVIGYNDTAYLVQAGVAPYFRYSPVLANLLFEDQVAELTRRIAGAPPDWIFITVAPGRSLNYAATQDSVRIILAAMKSAYVQQGTTGRFAIYRKADAASLAATLPQP